MLLLSSNNSAKYLLSIKAIIQIKRAPRRIAVAGAEEVVDGGAEPVELVRDGQVPPLQPAGGAVHTVMDRLVSLRV